jgi:hypothetical protein
MATLEAAYRILAKDNSRNLDTETCFVKCDLGSRPNHQEPTAPTTYTLLSSSSFWDGENPRPIFGASLRVWFLI